MAAHVYIDPVRGSSEVNHLQVYAARMSEEKAMHYGTIAVTSNGVTKNVSVNVMPMPTMDWEQNYSNVPAGGGRRFLTVVCLYPFSIYCENWNQPFTIYCSDDGFVSGVYEHSHNSFRGGTYTFEIRYQQNTSTSQLTNQIGLHFTTKSGEDSITSTNPGFDYYKRQGFWIKSWVQEAATSEVRSITLNPEWIYPTAAGGDYRVNITFTGRYPGETVAIREGRDEDEYHYVGFTSVIWDSISSFTGYFTVTVDANDSPDERRGQYLVVEAMQDGTTESLGIVQEGKAEEIVEVEYVLHNCVDGEGFVSNSIEVAKGSDVEIILKPNNGYRLDTSSISFSPQTPFVLEPSTGNNMKLRFTANNNISFEATPYKEVLVTYYLYNCLDSQGRETLSYYVSQGDQIVIELTPDTGYMMTDSEITLNPDIPYDFLASDDEATFIVNLPSNIDDLMITVRAAAVPQPEVRVQVDYNCTGCHLQYGGNTGTTYVVPDNDGYGTIYFVLDNGYIWDGFRATCTKSGGGLAGYQVSYKAETSTITAKINFNGDTTSVYTFTPVCQAEEVPTYTTKLFDSYANEVTDLDSEGGLLYMVNIYKDGNLINVQPEATNFVNCTKVGVGYGNVMFRTQANETGEIREVSFDVTVSELIPVTFKYTANQFPEAVEYAYVIEVQDDMGNVFAMEDVGGHDAYVLPQVGDRYKLIIETTEAADSLQMEDSPSYGAVLSYEYIGSGAAYPEYRVEIQENLYPRNIEYDILIKNSRGKTIGSMPVLQRYEG